jgi:hypothetical protein
MYTDSKLKPLRDDQQYIHPVTGTKYPPNWNKDNIDGLYRVTETPRPTREDVVVTGFVINDKHEQVWQTRPKTEYELARESEPKPPTLEERLAAVEVELAAVKDSSK